MKKLAFLLVILSVLGACKKHGPWHEDEAGNDSGSHGGDIKEILDVQATTGDVTYLFPTTARITGSVTIKGAKQARATVKFYYVEASKGEQVLLKGDSYVDAGHVLASRGGSFFASPRRLKPSTAYLYVAVASIDGKTFLGKPKTFTTTGPSTAPVVTGPVIDEPGPGVIITGYIDPDLTGSDVTVGAIYSTEDPPTSENGTVVTAGWVDENNMFEIWIDDLPPGTTYYYEAFVEEDDDGDDGTPGKFTYGDVEEFTTDDVTVEFLPVDDAENVDPDLAPIEGSFVIDDDNHDIEVWFEYSDDEEIIVNLPPWPNGPRGWRIDPEITGDPDDGFDIDVLVPDLEPDKDYYYVPIVKIDDDQVEKGDVVVIHTGPTPGPNRPSHPTGGKDIGLSVYWASCNVGATTPSGYGNYYAWGETSTKSNYCWETYKWCNGSAETLTKYNVSSAKGRVDNKTVLEAADDAAQVHVGGGWRTPTHEEMDELRNKCTWKWTRLNGVGGYRVTGKNKCSIFLPATGSMYYDGPCNQGVNGDYWSSSIYPKDPSCVWYYNFDKYNLVLLEYAARYDGRVIRPVKSK